MNSKLLNIRFLASCSKFNFNLFSHRRLYSAELHKQQNVTEGQADIKSEDSQNQSKDKQQSKWSKWTGANSYKLGLAFMGAGFAFGFGGLIYYWGPPEITEEGVEIEDQFTHLPTAIAYTRRTWKHLMDFNKSIRDPVDDKLLPDPVQPPYHQPPYTLVFEIKGVLVHPEWTWRTGWRFKKRPALELFLQQIAPYYELVAFTEESAMTASPVLQQMDPQGQYIHYHLFREATRYASGHHIKDLSCLNRSLQKVIYIDCEPKSYQLQPRNGLKLRKWEGDEADKELIDLAAFLRMIAMGGVEDIRTVLDYYCQFDDPLAVFREKHIQLMEEQAKKREESQHAPAKGSQGKWGFQGMPRR